jgi:glycosyltransferase involved in cell wall biosynthesis
VRIILTCNYSPWSSYSGGGQRSTHNLALALTSRGHDVTVVFTRPPWERVSAPAGLPYRLRWAGLASVNGKSPGLLRLSSVLPVARAVAELVRGQGATIVHSQGEEAAALPAMRRASGLPFGLVVTPRYPDYPVAPLDAHGGSRLSRLGALIRHGKYVALGVALRGADFCSPPSAHGAELAKRTFGLSDAQMAPVHNGVPVEFLDYRWAPGDAIRPLLFFGRFAESKGIDTLLAALRRLGDRAPHAILAGRGPLLSEIEAQLDASGLRDRVQLRGWVDHHELGRLLERSSMCVLPSREENFSLAVLSAMAVGTPLITTPVGGTPEVVVDQKNGLLVRPGDVTGLADAISRLQNDPPFAEHLATNGRECVRTSYTWDVAAAKFEALYARLLEAQRLRSMRSNSAGETRFRALMRFRSRKV